MKTTFAIVTCIIFTAAMPAHAQRPGFDRSLADPYRGIVAGGTTEKDVFKIESTGVSTEPVREAAVALLTGLSEEQRARTKFSIDEAEWRKWANQHGYKRQGVGCDEMTEPQRELAFAMMRAGLSAKGLKKSEDIMKLNGTLAELADDFEEYGE